MELPKNNAILRGILQDFMDGDLDIQREATEELKNMGQKAIDPLIQLIRDQKERKFIRLEAARAIGVLGADSVEPLLIVLQEDSDVIARMGTIRALGAIGDARAVTVLLDYVHDTEPKIKLAAIWTLGQIGDDQAIPVLLSLLNESDWGIHIETIEALIKIGDEAALFKSINPLVTAICNDDANIRRLAVTLLEKINEKVDLATTFTDVLNTQKDPILCKRLLEAIGELKDPSIVPLLISIIKEENALLRASAIAALQKIETEEAYKWAIQGLSDEDMGVRYSALDVLKNLKDERAVEPLIVIINDENTTAELLKKAIDALGEIGDPQAIDSLIGILEHPNPFLRAGVVVALGNIDSKRIVKPLIKMMNDDTDEEVRCLSRHILESSAKKMGYSSKDDLIKEIGL